MVLQIQVIDCITVISFRYAEWYFSRVILDHFNLLIPRVEYKFTFFGFD